MACYYHFSCDHVLTCMLLYYSDLKALLLHPCISAYKDFYRVFSDIIPDANVQTNILLFLVKDCTIPAWSLLKSSPVLDPRKNV